MRMLALGQLLFDEGYQIHFMTIAVNIEIVDRLRDEGFNVYCFEQGTILDQSTDLNKLLSLADQIKPSWMILDGYQFGESYEQEIKRAGYNLLRVDDIPTRHYYADIVLNQNFGANEFKYSTESYTQVLAGLQYVLLRREFRNKNHAQHTIRKKPPFNVMVSLGGSSDRTAALNQMISQGFSKLSEQISVTVFAGTSSKNIAEEMDKADFAIVSGGSTMWELIYMRVPFLAVALTSEQRDYLGSIANKGLFSDFVWHEDITQELVQKKILSCINDYKSMLKITENHKTIMGSGTIGKDLLALLNCAGKS